MASGHWMGHIVRVQRREEKVAHFTHMYHAIRNNEVYDNLQNDLIKERWK
jgi:hypothetical protein